MLHGPFGVYRLLVDQYPLEIVIFTMCDFQHIDTRSYFWQLDVLIKISAECIVRLSVDLLSGNIEYRYIQLFSSFNAELHIE